MSLHHYTEPPPPPTFSGPMQDELGRVAPSVDKVFELTPPDGVLRRYGTHATDGAAPQVAEMESPPSTVDIRSDDLASTEATVTILDSEDQAFGRLVATYPRSLRGSLASERLVSPRVSNAADEFRFDGIVDSVSLVGAGKWTVRFRPNDRALTSGYHLQEKISNAQWPNAHASALGQCVPWLYGEHSSVGIGGNGSIECLYVDTAGFRYMPSGGRIQAVDAVFADGVLVAPSGYAVTYATVGGLWCTLIDFTTDQLEKVITCDGRGLTDRGDGTGQLIRNRVAQVRHWLVNFVWNRWRQGAYYPEASAPLDLASFARVEALFEQTSDPEGSIHFSGAEPLRCSETFTEWLGSSKCKAYWTPAWRLALAVLNPLLPAYPEGDPIDLDVFGQEGISVPFDTSNLVRTLVAQHLNHSAEGAYKGTVTVADLSVPDDVTESLDLPWSPARVK